MSWAMVGAARLPMCNAEPDENSTQQGQHVHSDGAQSVAIVDEAPAVDVNAAMKLLDAKLQMGDTPGQHRICKESPAAP